MITLKLLAEGLSSIRELSVDFSESQTNMVLSTVLSHRESLEKFLLDKRNHNF